MKAFFRNYITGCRKEIAAVLLCSLFCSLLTVGCSGIMNRIVEETLGNFLPAACNIVAANMLKS